MEALAILSMTAHATAQGDITKAQAHWVSADSIASSLGGTSPQSTVVLHYAPSGRLTLGPGGVTGGMEIPLLHEPGGLRPRARERFPHLAHFPAWKVPHRRLGEVPLALKGHLAVSARDRSGRLLGATGIQIPGVLDDLYPYDRPLGPVVEGDRVTLRVWAPTARSVKLHLFDGPGGPESAVHEMAGDPRTGVFSAQGDRSWLWRFYLYEVEVFVPATGQVELNLVTDPYSLSLSRNGRRSQIVDLEDPSLKPPGWDSLVKPPKVDVVLYELHVRDFSASDPEVPESLRGTFKAFALLSSTGLRHLRSLAASGLTHVHLLPSFDMATVDEDRSQWRTPEGDLAHLPPDSDRQQAAVMAVADKDGFNWGYDPAHYTVPEGSYATDPDGPARIREFREMVKGLAESGLRVVMDVVYNHTHASGQNQGSVLDRIVPGYYHRLDGDGNVEHSTCCENTATEHAMMEKLMVDSVITWARAYKVDGFRFDLMGHHMKRNMLRVRQGLDALTTARDGMDGTEVIVYGEGWDFGEVGGGARGVNATQRNMAGTGIGSFNDRLRDASRGGGAFCGLQEQGFLTGLYDAPNASEHASNDERRARVLHSMDRIRVGLAGNLASFGFFDRGGHFVRGDQVDYGGTPTGYNQEPREAITYVEAHDNETLFDAIQLKAAAHVPLGERIRMQNLGMSLVGLGQGVPFFHAGVELLRSKSLDRNSYNSGDWFNRLDFTQHTNNWGVGLPPAPENRKHWGIMGPLLANPSLRPAPAEIRRATAHFHEVLKIRRSSPLFRLPTAAEVRARLRFHETGPAQTPGLIVMSLWDLEGRLDPAHPVIVVVFNAAASSVVFAASEFQGLNLRLHPVQAASDDPVLHHSLFDPATGRFQVPGHTTAVFWSEAR